MTAPRVAAAPESDALATPSSAPAWTSRAGFLLATIGAATGLGGLWRFPFIAGEHGGSAFVIVYCLFVLLLGLPIMLAEMALGRLGKASAIGSMRALVAQGRHSRFWLTIGYCSVLVPFVGLSFYAVVAGWSLDYLYLAVIGSLEGATPGTSAAAFNDHTASPGRQLLLHAAFILITVAVVGRGVVNGVERASKIMMPALFALIVALAFYNMIAGRGGAAFAFLFKPDFSKLTTDVILMAMSQALFSLAVGAGMLMTYSAYASPRDNLPASAGIVAAVNTLFSLFAGLAIFSVVFQFGLSASEGPGLLFVTLPVGFAQMKGGWLIAALFFLLVVFAAWTTTIGMLEPIVSWLEERLRWTRTKLALLAGFAVWIFGLPAALSFNTLAHWHPFSGLSVLGDKTAFGLYDFLVTSILLPLNALLLALFSGRVIGARRVADSLGIGDGWRYDLWRLSLRFVVPLAILWVWLAAFW